MNLLRRAGTVAIFAAVLLAAPLVARAAPPPPVPPIADSDRYQSYNISSPTSSVDVDFPVFGDCTDIVVALNGVPLVLNTDFTCASTAGGSDLTILPLPITDLVVTFSAAPTTNLPTGPPSSGTLTITGAWHPRDLVQPTSPGINRREFNQTVSTLIASQRELYHLQSLFPLGTNGSIATGGAKQLAYYPAAGMDLAPVTGLTPGLPLFAGSPVAVGSLTGNTTELVTYSGLPPVAGDCSSYDADGNLIDNGACPSLDFTQQGSGAVQQTIATKLYQAPLSPYDFGAKCDAVSNADGAIASSTAAFSSALANFTSADIGKVIRVAGAGTAGAALNTTISAFIDAHDVTLAANAATTVSSALYVYGTDDTTPLQDAINQAEAASPAFVKFPGAGCLATSLSVTNALRLDGDGFTRSVLWLAPTEGISVVTPLAVQFENFGISYTQVTSTTHAITLSAGTGLVNDSSIFKGLQILRADECFQAIQAAYFDYGGGSKCLLYGTAAFDIANTVNGDDGDSTIHDTVNLPINSSSLYCLFWHSSGGLRFENNKCLGAEYGFYIDLASGVSTSQLIITGNSFDGIQDAALYAMRAGSTGSLVHVLFNNNACNGVIYCAEVPTDANGTWIFDLSVVGTSWYSPATGSPIFANISTVGGFVIGDDPLVSNVSAAVPFNGSSSATRCVVGPFAKSGTFATSTNSGSCTVISPD